MFLRFKLLSTDIITLLTVGHRQSAARMSQRGAGGDSRVAFAGVVSESVACPFLIRYQLKYCFNKQRPGSSETEKRGQRQSVRCG